MVELDDGGPAAVLRGTVSGTDGHPLAGPDETAVAHFDITLTG